ncbi:glucose/galactose 1-dehydrogenase [Acrasis kona]|uniref:Glucose/galactose 1-dehydrogenase n=1 Tax=Acrasis kona TaxID=1008807 RepID=A0AAW2YWC0_9EUKA
MVQYTFNSAVANRKKESQESIERIARINNKTKTYRKDQTNKLTLKLKTFGDIAYYEAGVNDWNQPEKEYMYRT